MDIANVLGLDKQYCYLVVGRERFGARGIRILYICPIQWRAKELLIVSQPSNRLAIFINNIQQQWGWNQSIHMKQDPSPASMGLFHASTGGQDLL